MDVYTYPQPFCIENNFCTDDEIKNLLTEMRRMIPDMSSDPRISESATTKDGKYLAKRKGIFVKVKENDPFDKLQKKIMDPSRIEKLVSRNSLFGYLTSDVKAGLLVSLFEEGDEYEYHTDKAIISITYYIWEGEFEGGNFILEDSIVPAGHNSIITFPSCLKHKVTQVKGKGRRWSITMFINYMDNNFGPPIQTFPNFLTNLDYEYISEIGNKLKWEHSGVSLEGPPKFLYSNLMAERFFSEYLFNKIPGGPWELKRVYANGQVYGQNGDFHTDDVDPNTFTFLLYTNKIDSKIMDKWGGQTEFMINGNNFLIYPDPNKAILFPSTILHRGFGPSRFVADMRVTIAWKLSKKNLG